MAKTKPHTKAAPRDDPKSSVPSLIIFIDIRGFTRWAENTEVFVHLNHFIQQFLEIITKRAGAGSFIKGLGDGAMILQEIADEKDNQSGLLLDRALALVKHVQTDFDALCQTFASQIGHKTDLMLGWGIVRGDVKKLPGDGDVKKRQVDYVGSNVNKAARLCDVARPFGVVLDQADFPEAKDIPEPRFYPQTRRLSGLQEVDVWVTKEVFSQFSPREKLRENPEVHVAGMCIEEGDRGVRLLIARRGSHRRLFRDKYEGCGGQLQLSETFAEGVARHFRLEMGIEVEVLEKFHCFYVIREPETPKIPGIRFLCKPLSDKKPESLNHSEVKWVSEADFRNIPDNQFVEGLKLEVLLLLDQYKGEKTRRGKSRAKGE